MRLLVFFLTIVLLTIAGLPVSGQEQRAPDAGSSPPDTVSYETWFAGGSRVDFAHDLHADMLGLSCSECHHAEDCRSCHLADNVTTFATNSRIALHGVCFRCHAQGATLSECSYCHKRHEEGEGYSGVENSARLSAEESKRILQTLTEARANAKLRIVGEVLPFERETPPPPEEHIFLASQQEGVSLVYFPHTAHSEQYNIACASCHHMQRCSHCHYKTNSAIQVVSARAALMDHCISCHQDEGLVTNCESCHQDPHPMRR